MERLVISSTILVLRELSCHTRLSATIVGRFFPSRKSSLLFYLLGARLYLSLLVFFLSKSFVF